MLEKSLKKILGDSGENELTLELLMRLLSELEVKSEDESPGDYGESYIQKLQALYESFSKEIEFKPGQLVVWKDGLQNKKLPHKNQPAIVVKVLDSPLFEDKDSGTPYFQEPLDLVLAVIGENKGELLVFYYDKRRFRLYPQP